LVEEIEDVAGSLRCDRTAADCGNGVVRVPANGI
jgi:hypothetical protein